MDDVEYENITDPHDFKTNQFVALDSALRCSICKDLINIPMIAPCSHSFCSLCIRESLSVKPECPVCRASTTDGQLKKNTTLFEVVDAYKAARSLILKHESTVENLLAVPIPEPSESLHVLGKRKRDQSDSGGDTSKFPQLQHFPSDPSPSSSKRSLFGQQPDEHYVNVPCPICDEYMETRHINRHLDSGCAWTPTHATLNVNMSEKPKGSKQNNGETQVKAWASVFTSGGPSTSKSRSKGQFLNADEVPMKRLSKVNYDIKSIKQLRELLSEAGLSDKGDVSQLRLRHERWVNLWNAEIDAKHPRSRHSLLKDMTEWENARMRAKPLPKVESDKWLETNKRQFDLLISTARLKPRNEPNGQETTSENEQEDSQGEQEEMPVEEVSTPDTAATGPDQSIIELSSSPLPSR